MPNILFIKIVFFPLHVLCSFGYVLMAESLATHSLKEKELFFQRRCQTPKLFIANVVGAFECYILFVDPS
jgi:hypothetical protein